MRIVELGNATDAWDDFEHHCPRASEWVAARYREAARFGHDHVWLRKDRFPAEEPDPDDDPSPDAP